MPEPQVNRTRAIVALLLISACTPANNTRQGSESTAVTRTDTATLAHAATDSIITRADLARIQGSTAAPVWVIEVSDFECPYCKEWHEKTYAALRDQYVKTGKVRLAYVNFPLNIHPHAFPAAESAMCAGAQDRFWQMHDALFTSQSRWQGEANPTTVFDSLAQANGLEMRRWRECVSSGKMRPLIEADHERAMRAGATATPTFLIGDQLLAGAQSIEELKQAIDLAMVKNRTQ